jgi:hypothetical protein
LKNFNWIDKQEIRQETTISIKEIEKLSDEELNKLI